jgi:hypothetical protein
VIDGAAENRENGRDGKPLPLVVECREGHRDREKPRRFGTPGRMIGIDAIVSAWREPGARVFRVRDEHGAEWLLRLQGDVWTALRV